MQLNMQLAQETIERMLIKCRSYLAVRNCHGRLAVLALLVPVVTVECELGFSATNRIKTSVTKSRRNPAIEKVACKIDAHLLTLRTSEGF